MLPLSLVWRIRNQIQAIREVTNTTAKKIMASVVMLMAPAYGVSGIHRSVDVQVNLDLVDLADVLDPVQFVHSPHECNTSNTCD